MFSIPDSNINYKFNTYLRNYLLNPHICFFLITEQPKGFIYFTMAFYFIFY